MEQSLAQWLKQRCEKEGLSLRQVAAKTGLSHTTIAEVLKGTHPSPETIGKLAQTFGGDGHQRLALEDRLLVLAHYRTQRSKEEPNEAMARVLDKISHFSESQLKIVAHFADFLSEMEE